MRTQNCAGPLVLLFVAAIPCGSVSAGEITPVSQDRYVSGDARVTDDDGQHADGGRVDAKGFEDFQEGAGGDVERYGGYASGGGNQRSVIGPATIDAYGAAFANAGAWEQDTESNASGRSYFDVAFTIDEAVDFAVTITLAEYDNGSVSFAFNGPDGPVVIAEVEHNYDRTTNASGTLEPGDYRIIGNARGSAFGYSGYKDYAFSSFDVLLELAVAGDVNGDGNVDFTDVLELLSAWGECDGECPADLNEDGYVDFEDLLIVLANWS